MSKPPHPVEAYEASVIANAVCWTTFQARGPFDRQKEEHPTREAAREDAQRLIAERPDRSVMIYAVNAEGRQALAETIRR